MIDRITRNDCRGFGRTMRMVNIEQHFLLTRNTCVITFYQGRLKEEMTYLSERLKVKTCKEKHDSLKTCNSAALWSLFWVSIAHRYALARFPWVSLAYRWSGVQFMETAKWSDASVMFFLGFPGIQVNWWTVAGKALKRHLDQVFCASWLTGTLRPCFREFRLPRQSVWRFMEKRHHSRLWSGYSEFSWLKGTLICFRTLFA